MQKCKDSGKSLIKIEKKRLLGLKPKQKETFLAKVIEDIKSNREDDPLAYIFSVDDEIKNMSIEIDNMSADFSAPNTYDEKTKTEEEVLVKC